MIRLLCYEISKRIKPPLKAPLKICGFHSVVKEIAEPPLSVYSIETKNPTATVGLLYSLCKP